MREYHRLGSRNVGDVARITRVRIIRGNSLHLSLSVCPYRDHLSRFPTVIRAVPLPSALWSVWQVSLRTRLA